MYFLIGVDPIVAYLFQFNLFLENVLVPTERDLGVVDLDQYLIRGEGTTSSVVDLYLRESSAIGVQTCSWRATFLYVFVPTPVVTNLVQLMN
jgi:hypothetical protein